MTDQQQADLRHDEVEAGTTTVLGTPSVDVTSDSRGVMKRNW